MNRDSSKNGTPWLNEPTRALQGSQDSNMQLSKSKGDNSMLAQSVPHVNPWRVDVLSITPVYNDGNVKAYVNIHIVGLFKMDGLKVVQQPGQRAWVAMPDNAQRLPDHRPGIYEVNNELKAAIWQAVFSAWGVR